MKDVLYYPVLIPKNLDLRQILNEVPPDFKYKEDYFKYLVSFIYNKPTITNPDFEDFEYVEISSTSLKNRIPDYKKYINYLVAENVLHTDNFYYKSSSSHKSYKCKGYKFSESIFSMPKSSKVTDYVLVKKLTRFQSERNRIINERYGFLRKWFNAGLEIDKEKADKFLLDQYLINKKELKEEKGIRKNELSYVYNSQKIEKLAQKMFHFGVDENVGRLHTNLTVLKKDVRNYVSYNGQSLVSVDLKNSQPFLSTKLMTPEFYKPNGSYNVYELIKRYPKLALVKEIKMRVNGVRIIDKIISDSYTMFRDYEQTFGREGFGRYEKEVLNGNLYEDFTRVLHDTKIFMNAPRDEVKRAVLKCLYSSNKFSSPIKKLFEQTYPDANFIFRALKETDKSILPRLLQLIESDLFIQKIAKRISQEKPILPIFTIHDSIVTIEGNEDYVKSVLIEEFGKIMSAKPVVSLEYWR